MNVYINVAAHEEVNSPERQLCDYFVSNRCSFVDCVARNLESFVVPLTMIRKIHKNNRNKTDTCLEGWGVEDTHFTGSHIGGIHISLGICVWGYTYHGDTHITVTADLSVGPGNFSFYDCSVAVVSSVVVWSSHLSIKSIKVRCDRVFFM